MIKIHRTSLLALALALPAAADRRPPPSDASREALRALDDPSLAGMRAGRSAVASRWSEDDRAALQSAQVETGEPLLEMRAGDTLTTVLLVALVVLLILVLI